MIAAVACIGLHGCAYAPASSQYGSVSLFDRPAVAQRLSVWSSSLLFDPTPSAADPASFVRREWPSTPRKWTVVEEVRWHETVRGYQGYDDRDHHYKVFRSDRRGRSRASWNP